MDVARKYAKVILPLKFRGSVSYSITPSLADNIKIGSRVNVPFGNKNYIGIVEEISDNPEYDVARIRDIDSTSDTPGATAEEIKFWKDIARYYMCSVGEVLKTAAAFSTEIPPKKEKLAGKKKKSVKDTKTSEEETLKHDDILPFLNMNILTPAQQEAYDKIRISHRKGHSVILDGETCSGKTEICIYAIKECLEMGKNALVLTPDVSSCKLMGERLGKIFEEKMLLFHSKITDTKKKGIFRTLIQRNGANIVVGTRSSIFLPLCDLGIIVVDNENEHSYKQSELSPRYNARDAALMLAKETGAGVILVSSTPSFETILNIRMGKYDEVSLREKYAGSRKVITEIVDFRNEEKKHAIKGYFTFKTIRTVEQAIKENTRIAIFIPRRILSKEEELTAQTAAIFHDTGICIYSDICEMESLQSKPSLVIILYGELIINSQDFRADEKAIQLLSRIRGVVEKGDKDGMLLIQTSQPSHSIFKSLTELQKATEKLIKERKEFDYPPFTRMLKITVRDIFPNRLEINACKIEKTIKDSGIDDYIGPTPPPYERNEKEHSLIFNIRLKRDRRLEQIKDNLLQKLEKYGNSVAIDVDPQ